MILVIDNYDSFTYNLVQLLRVQGAHLGKVEVVRNDAESAAAMIARRPTAIVLSPGPGRPEDAGECCNLVRAEVDLPILGVCLGHQVLGEVFGARVDRAPRLMHGKVSAVSHNGMGIFAGLPVPFEATRYHSLAVLAEGLPA
ncbi:MAG: anthranilate/aminodeoxychorismate synthase component II, partial [Acidobacteriota bacterium]|nr:anthranilate/aminodeoxychorismate synthase component II [Acidobacteriota bacterium]